MNKKTLKKEYQLLFELVNKVLFPHTEMRSTVVVPNLFLMEALPKFQKRNLLVIVIEHMNTVMMSRDGKHSLAYEFWLNRVFAYFNIECGHGKAGSVKQMFDITALEDNECIFRSGGGKSKSTITDLIDIQTRSREKLDEMATLEA